MIDRGAIITHRTGDTIRVCLRSTDQVIGTIVRTTGRIEKRRIIPVWVACVDDRETVRYSYALAIQTVTDTYRPS